MARVAWSTRNLRTLALAARIRREPNVRFGSKADMCVAKSHVRFTPESRHVRCTSSCLLCANSGHQVVGRDSIERASHCVEHQCRLAAFIFISSPLDGTWRVVHDGAVIADGFATDAAAGKLADAHSDARLKNGVPRFHSLALARHQLARPFS